MASTWPPIGTNVEANLFAGGKGGIKSSHKDAANPITKIEAWGNPDSVRAIRISWDGNNPGEKTFGNPGPNVPQVIQLAKDEKFTAFSAWTGPFVHKIEIKTSKGQSLWAGDPTHLDGAINRIDMSVASGHLVGLYATSDSNKIFRLTPYFVNSVKVGRTYNTQGGSSGGDPFTAVSLTNRVMKVRGWWGNSAACGNVMRGIEITWENGVRSKIYGTSHRATQDSSYTFDLSPQETITSCSMRTGWRVDQLAFQTSKKNKKIWGGPLGSYFAIPDLGTGILLGFEGRVGDDIDMLAPVFAKLH